MASTGFQYPGTVVDWQGVTSNLWTLVDRVKLADGIYTDWVGPKFPENSPGDGPELRTSNYGFAVPATATITGVELKIHGATDANVVSEMAYLVTSSSIIGTQKTNDWTTIPTTAPHQTPVYGSSSDLWSATLTPAVVNSSNFGWHFMIFDDLAPLQMQVDYMQMNVHYEEAAATPPIILMIGV